jgi:hypothetical protein
MNAALKPSAPVLFVTTGANRFAANVGPPSPLSFAALATAIMQPVHVGKLTLAEYQHLKAAKDDRAAQDKDSRWFSLATFKDGRRANDNVTAMAGFVGDLDEGRHTLEQLQAMLAEWAHIIFTTYSHSAANPRYRVVIPYAAPVTPADHGRLFAWFNADVFDNALDTAASDEARLNYCAACCADQHDAVQFHYHDAGVYFDPAPVLAMAPTEAANGPKSTGLTNTAQWSATHPDLSQAIAARRAAYPEFDALMRGESTNPDASANDASLVWHLLICSGGNGQAVYDLLMDSDPPHPMKRDKWDRRLEDDICSAFDKQVVDPKINVSRVGFGACPAPAGMSLEPLPPAPVAEATPAPRQPKPPIDWRKCRGLPPKRTWFIEDWLGPSPTGLWGKGGAGKTTLGQALATSLAMGINYLGPVAEPKVVLYWNCEDDMDEIWRTQAAINAFFKISMDELLGSARLHIVARRGETNGLMEQVFGKATLTPVMEELRQQVNDLGADVLMLDNIAQVYGGQLNDPHQVTMFVNAVAGLVRNRPFTPFLFGHLAKAVGSEFSGTAAWENAMRMRWFLGPQLPDQKPDKEDDDAPVVQSDVAYLAKRKANYSPKDYKRFTYQRGLLVPDSLVDVLAGLPVPFGSGKVREDAADALVLAAMPKLLTMGLQPSDSPQAKDYLPRQMKDKGLAADYRQSDLRKAMNRLMGADKLRRVVVGKQANRSDDKWGLVVV